MPKLVVVKGCACICIDFYQSNFIEESFFWVNANQTEPKLIVVNGCVCICIKFYL